jgi:hypothetical protein
MPGGPDREQPLSVRRFTGTIVAIDPAFLPPGMLTQCDNWVPDPTYVLTKRRGSLMWQTLPGAGRCDPLVYTMGSDGHRYLYAVAGDRLYLSIDDGTFAVVPNGTFATPSPRYGAAAIGDTLYVGNDSDPLKQVPLGAAAIDLVQLGLADDTGQVVAWVDDVNSNLVAGTYSYRWATYNTTTKRWTKLAPVRTTTTGATSRQRLMFTGPTGGLATNERWHLFVAGVDQEIEGAHDQVTDGFAVSTGAAQWAMWDQPTIDTTAVPIPSTVARHGSHLVAHRGALWGAGGVGVAAQRVWSTSVLIPGLEQNTFDQGVFFPAMALSPDLGDPVTGLTVVPQSSGSMQPTAPLAMFTLVTTWLFSGDLVGDPGASFMQISGEVGCISDRTIVATPLGVVFCGKRSVYLLTPAAAEPRDVGWPIESAVRAMPAAVWSRAWAVYHRGFYKLALVPPGATEPTQQWWLDIRRGLGDPPSWWGPHTMPPYSAGVRAATHPSEDDREWAVQGNPAQVLLIDQADRYIEDGVPPVPIVSRMTTGYLDGGAPLTPKLAKRARIIARADGPTALALTVAGDEALSTSSTLPIPVATGGIWNASDWDVSDWTVLGLALVEFECPVPELRARAFQATVSHTDAVRCDLRDFELRVQPSFRETR